MIDSGVLEIKMFRGKMGSTSALAISKNDVYFPGLVYPSTWKLLSGYVRLSKERTIIILHTQTWYRLKHNFLENVVNVSYYVFTRIYIIFMKLL